MPKLSLRDLFAVVTVVALALGWWVDHWRQSGFAIRVKELDAQLADLRADLEDQRQQINWNRKLYLDAHAAYHGLRKKVTGDREPPQNP